MQQQHLERLSKHDKCPSLTSKGSFCKCNCLTILRDENVRDAVATYVLDYQKMDPVARGQRIVEWYKYAGRAGNDGGTGRQAKFALPFDRTDIIMSEEAETKMNNAFLCTSALGNLLDIGQATLTRCKKLAKSTGVFPKLLL